MNQNLSHSRAYGTSDRATTPWENGLLTNFQEKIKLAVLGSNDRDKLLTTLLTFLMQLSSCMSTPGVSVVGKATKTPFSLPIILQSE